MIKSIQLIFKIFLTSPNLGVNQMTAKAALTQMVTSTFAKLERMNIDKRNSVVKTDSTPSGLS